MPVQNWQYNTLPAEYTQPTGLIVDYAYCVKTVRAILPSRTLQDVQVDKFLGTLSHASVESYSPGLDANQTMSGIEGLQSLSGSQEVTDGEFQVRLYRGRIANGQWRGTPVVMKAYPSRFLREADMFAANELVGHSVLQPPSVEAECPHLAYLIGGFQTEVAGEQWLIFRDDGISTAGTYAEAAARATFQGGSVGPGDLMDLLDRPRPLRRRRKFVLRLMRQVLRGLAFMHAQGRVHHSLGPTSVCLSTTDETRADQLQARLSNLALSVDVRDAALWGGATLAELWEGRDYRGKADYKTLIADQLWAKAASAGAKSNFDKRSFGIADDVYSAGLLLAHMAFVPLSEPGSVSNQELQRLIEVTFKYDFDALREFCLADDRWALAVDFLDVGNRAGWELIQAMLNPSWRLRPTAAACLKHPFLTGAAFDAQPPPSVLQSTPAEGR